MRDSLTIGEMSQRSGVPASALRFYESRGLIRSLRTSGNQRRYHRAELRRIAFIRIAQRVGLSLDEINQALSGLPAARTPTKADWARLSAAWRSRLDEQIALLERLRDRLTSCIGCGCLSLRRCQIANPADELAEQGAGAYFLVSNETPGQQRT
ncbi:MAG TPA: redox-sensitive transcriptional activator SoxR [Micromonosporaceae bacterium]